MNCKFDISVIIPVYNRSQYVNEAIESVIRSSGNKQAEIIVVTNIDLSIDPNHTNVKLIKTPIKSLSEKLAIGSKSASSDIIAFLEDDDLWCNEKVRKIIDVFNEHEEVDLFHNKNIFIRDNVWSNEVIGKGGEGVFLAKNSIHNSNKTIRTIVRENIGFNLSSMAIRKSLMLEHIDILTSLTVYGIDSLVLAITMVYGNGIYIDKCVRTLVRLHKNNSFIGLFHCSDNFLHKMNIVNEKIKCQDNEVCKYLELMLVSIVIIEYSRSKNIKLFSLLALFLKYVKGRLALGFPPESYIIVTVLSRLISMKFYYQILTQYHK